MQKALIIGLLLLFTGMFSLHAQECEWINTSHAAGDQHGEFMAMDRDDNIIIVGRCFAPVKKGPYNFTNLGNANSSGPESNFFLLKYDVDSNILAGWQPNFLSGHSWFLIRGITTDINNNVYITGDFMGYIQLWNGKSLNNPTLFKRDFLIKLSPDLKVEWAKDIGSGNIGAGSTLRVFMSSSVDSCIYIGFHFKYIFRFTGGDSLVSPYAENTGLAKFSSSGILQWGTYVGSQFGHYLHGLDCDDAGNCYLLLKPTANYATLFVGPDTLAGGGLVIAKCSPAGVMLHGIRNYSTLSPSSSYNSIMGNGLGADDAGNFAVTGTFKDTAFFGNTMLVATGSNNENTFLAYYNSDLQLKWIRKDEPASTAITYQTSAPTIKNNFIYYGVVLSGQTRFGSFVLGSIGDPGLKQYYIKSDTLGNFLWAFGGIRTLYINTPKSMNADINGNLYIVGSFEDTLTIFNQKAKTTGWDFFLARVKDYSITRGNVYAGPYCAGDSIDIPFVKYGNYDTANYFYAEISDEEGNFDGAERELGRLKSDTDGVIRGTLPLFQVASSGKYRIRIRSTHPQVQSFYKKDSLRLLVYSRDSADAGPDLFICPGQTITLSTWGGTKWHWSPAGLQNDSTSRSISVSPVADTEYRIAISDSSGCGVSDTDHVKVFIRPALSVNPRADTVICKGQAVALHAKGTGGDTLRHVLTWLHGTDTLASLLVAPDTTTTYLVILSDSCTAKPDSGYVTIIVRPRLSVAARPDTVICQGQALNLFADGMGGDSASYTFSWDQGIGNGQAHVISPDTSITYRVILTDHCMPENDTAFVSINVRPPLSLASSSDTNICAGQPVELSAFASGGDSLNYHIEWQGLGSGSSMTVAPLVTTSYTAILTDNCNADPDTAMLTVNVEPPVSVSLTPDSSICLGQSVQLSAMASGGDNSYSYLWDNGDTANSRTVSPTVTTTYLLVASDNCTVKSDSSFVTITVRPPLEVIPRPDTTICKGQTVLLFASAAGGDSAASIFDWDQNVGTGNFISVSPAQTTTYRVIADDNCSAEDDTGYVTVSVRGPLKVLPMRDTAVCLGQAVTLYANGTGGDSLNYTFSWDQGVGNTNFVKVQPVQTTIYKVVLSDNCTIAQDTGFVKITAEPLPQPGFTVSVNEGCQPLEAAFKNTTAAAAAAKVKWDFGNGDSSLLNDPTYTYHESGLYDVVLHITTLAGCTDSLRKPGLVKVNPLPRVRFRATPRVAMIGTPVITFTNLTTQADTFSWNYGDGTFLDGTGKGPVSHTYPDTGNYIVMLEATNAYGCIASGTDTVRVEEEYRFYIPNSFTPNGDGLNDEFMPSALFTTNYQLTIYDRWGNQIYSGVGKGWDGKTAGGEPMPGGAYLYMFTSMDKAGNAHHAKGTVILLR